MSYTRKTVKDRILIEGNYIPEGYDCQCKSCKFSIEVPVGTDDKQIAELVDKVVKR